MTDVSGYELTAAEALLTAEGYRVTSVEVRSRKGVDGGVQRVIRQKLIDDNIVELCYAGFICVPVRRIEKETADNE